MKFWSLIVVVLMLGTLGGCISNTTTADITPSPQSEDDGVHSGFSKRVDAVINRIDNSIEGTGYHFFGVNAKYPPYDTLGGTLHRDLATMEQTIDWHLFNNDWSDYDYD
ncbi:MAG: hypothetical protein V3W41_18935 [Planctomycetota bacterium]